MTAEVKKYMIKTFNDFRQVPKDRLHVCMTEFMMCLLSLPLAGELTYFEWIDDGQHNVTCHMDFREAFKDMEQAQ